MYMQYKSLMFVPGLRRDVGKLLKGVGDYLKVFKDPNSPYVFNILPDSIIFDRNVGRKFGDKLFQKCSSFLSGISAISGLSNLYRNSTKGVGIILKEVDE